MKTARVLLLVLLAVLLPLRGALAEAVHRGGIASASHGVEALGHQHTVGAHHAPAVEADRAAESAHHGHAAGATDACSACTVSCSSPAFVAASPTVAAPIVVAGSPFPAVIAPPPSHASERQERPPRSL